MASCFNTVLPLSFAFRSGETKELYNYHFDRFQKFLNINLKNFTFLSDQGPALKGLYKDYSIKHCFCLHHILVNLKFNQFSFAVNENIRKPFIMQA